MRYSYWLSAAVVVLATSMQARGVTLNYDIQKELGLYGYLNQHVLTDFGGPGDGNYACGPTAAVNSFMYLQNKYVGNYNGALVPGGNLAAVAQTLGTSYMNTLANGTTYHDDFIWGKYQYLETVAPGKTTYEAQDYWTWTHHTPFSWVSQRYPTWSFLYNQLVHCEDVEILLSWTSGGHYLTLTSFHWTDVDTDGVIDVSEGATIDYIDPWTGAWATSAIWHAFDAGNPFLETNYHSGAWISMAVKESPEPGTIALVAIGGLVLLRRRRAA